MTARFALLLGLVTSLAALDQTAAEAWLRQLPKVHAGGAAVPAWSLSQPAFTPAEAMQMQTRLIDLLPAAQASGYKVGFTSVPAQQAWGMGGPASGRLFQSQLRPTDNRIPLSDFHTPIIEAEIAFILETAIATQADLDDLPTKVASWQLAIELPDLRFDPQAGKPTGTDVVADNLGAHRYVLGAAQPPDTLDLQRAVRLSRGDQVLSEANATAALGSPWNVLAWLAEQELAAGRSLAAGSVILTGALGKPQILRDPAAAAGVYTVRSGELSVSITIE